MGRSRSRTSFPPRNDRSVPTQMIGWARARLANYKVPRYVEFRDTDFERTPSLRVRKEVLKQGDLVAGAWDREAEHGRV